MLTKCLLHAKYCFSYSFQLLFNNHHLEKYYKFLPMLFGNSYTGKLQSQISEVIFPTDDIFSFHKQTLKSPIGHGSTPFQILYETKQKPTNQTQSVVYKKMKGRRYIYRCAIGHFYVSTIHLYPPICITVNEY